MFFLRKSTLELLPVAMIGVRMGERVLQIGVDNPTLVGALAAKVGLSGQATIVVRDEASAARARGAAQKVGALVDVHMMPPLQALPFADSSFDVVVVHGIGGFLASLDDAARVALLRESFRALRTGGRIVVIESGTRGGLAGLLRPSRASGSYGAEGGAVGALSLAGFRAPRILADREGYKFSEALKG